MPEEAGETTKKTGTKTTKRKRKVAQKQFKWRDHLDPKYITLKEEYAEELERKYKEPFAELQKLVKTGEDNVADFYKFILLEGYRGIARARGYTCELLDPNCVTPDYCSFTSTVTWEENEHGPSITTSDVGECFAMMENPPFSNFPSALAANRAFIRNIRKYMGIPILGKDEVLSKALPPEQAERAQNKIIDNTEEATQTVAKEPYQILRLKCEKFGFGFNGIKKSSIQNGIEGAEMWEDWKDIPEVECFAILQKVMEKQKAKEAE